MDKALLVISIMVIVAFVGCTSDHEHDHSVEISGSDMKQLTVQEVAELWEIDSDMLLQRIIQEFGLKGAYTVNSVLEDLREEYKFSPAQIKDLAEEIKTEGMQNE